MRDDFVVFIITHKRPDNQITYKTLKRGKYTGKIIFVLDDGDDTIDAYCEKYGKENIQVFHKYEDFDIGDNLTDHKGVPVYARNICFKIAREKGYKYFVQLDDDYPKIDYRYVKDGKLKAKPVSDFDKLFEAMCKFMEPEAISCVAFAVAGDYIGGANGRYRDGLYRNARNSFFCRTDRPFEFLGRINEDVTTPAVNNMLGRLFFTFMGVQVTLYDHEKNKGGSTEQYREVNLYWNYFYPVLYIIILSDSKEQLHMWKAEIQKFVETTLRLSLNQKTCIRPISQGIEFVGYRIWPHYVTIRKSTTLEMKRHLRRKVEEYNAGLIEMEVVTATLKSYLGMLDHCDCKEFRKELIDSVVLDRNKVIGEIAYEVENYSEAMVCGL